jgi:hypothetical protein
MVFFWMQIVILRQPMLSVWINLRMSHGHSHLYNVLAAQWGRYVQRIIKLCTIAHTASMARTTIWMPLFIECYLLRSTTGNQFKFIRMFASVDQFLAKKNIVLFNLRTNPHGTEFFFRNSLGWSDFRNLIYYFASPPPPPHKSPSQDLISNEVNQSMPSHHIPLKSFWTWLCICT